MESDIEYKGLDILVRSAYVVVGPDPMAEATEGFVADIRKKDPIEDDPGRTTYDFPFDPCASYFEAATQDEVIAQAKAFIDAGGKRKPFSARRSGSEDSGE